MGSDGQVTSTTAIVPAWVPCPRREIQDFHRVAYETAGRTRSPRVVGMLDAIDWVVGCEPLAPISQKSGEVTEMSACAEMNLSARAPHDNTWAVGVGEALAYLVGLLSGPPLEVPRRNPDGGVVGWEQLYNETAQPWWTPEKRWEEQQAAQRTASRWAALADRISP